MIGVFRTGRWTSLVVTALALVLCLSTWFSATSVAPTLVSTLSLKEADEIWLTNAVQAGFVFGALLSSFLIDFRCLQCIPSYVRWCIFRGTHKFAPDCRD